LIAEVLDEAIWFRMMLVWNPSHNACASVFSWSAAKGAGVNWIHRQGFFWQTDVTNRWIQGAHVVFSTIVRVAADWQIWTCALVLVSNWSTSEVMAGVNWDTLIFKLTFGTMISEFTDTVAFITRIRESSVFAFDVIAEILDALLIRDGRVFEVRSAVAFD